MKWRRSLTILTGAAVVAVNLVPALVVAPAQASAATSLSSYVFVNENPNGLNEVASYNVTASGTMTLVGSYPTGHPGSDASYVASERADLSLDMSATTGHLYALNLGDSTLSIFSINGLTGQLTLQTTTPPLDATAIAVNHTGTVLYAGGSTNEGSANELSAYLINPDGTIDTTPVSTVAADVDGIAISPNGLELATAYPGTSSVTPSVQLFATNTAGALSAGTPLPESCPTDVRFAPTGTSLYSVGCTGVLTAYSVNGTQLTQTGTLSPVVSQTLAVASNGTLYVETPSGLQSVTISGTTFTPGPATAYPTNQTVTSMTVSPDGSQLFVGSFSSTAVNDYAIGSGGALSLANQVPTVAGLPTEVAITDPCPGVNSTCVDPQDMQVTVNPGTLTITTPYTPSNPFVLPSLQLSSDGTYLFSSATFPSTSYSASQQIVVTSSLAADPGWTLSVAASDLTDGTGGTISSSGLGLTNGTLDDTGTFPGTLTFTNLPAHNPSPVDTDTNLGLGSTPQSWATTPAGDGTAVINGTLTLLAPTDTPAGSYSGTISFSVS